MFGERLCRAEIPASEEGLLRPLVLGSLSLEKVSEGLGVRPEKIGLGEETGFASVGKDAPAAQSEVSLG